MTLNRTTPPPTGEFPPLSLPQPDKYFLSNGIEVFACNRGDEDVCRIDLMLEGGYYVEQKPSTSALTLLMLKEGAAGKSSEEIAESFDYHGAWLQTSASSHHLYVTLYTLNRHLDTCIPLLADIVIRPDFPEKEFARLKERRIQQLLVQKEKVDTLASEAYLAALFGKEHPYGRAISPGFIDNVTCEDLRNYHKRYIQPDKCRIFIAGKITQALLDNLEKHFAQSWPMATGSTEQTAIYPIQRSSNRLIFVHKENALQSGIRIGLPAIGREDPHFFALKLLCTILGGYFGSRLMSNIREEKGYTYGITSSLAALRYGNYLVISTQTGTEFTQPLIDEVFVEINRLRNELVSNDELTVVKNYLRGEMARTLDSPFSITDYYLSLTANNLSTEYFARQDQAMRRLTADNLLDVAQKYLCPEQFYIVVAGDRNKIPPIFLPEKR